VVAVGDPEEPMAHQFGTIPVGLQLLFGVSELAIHHDDLADARGSRYQPRGAVVQALVPVWERVLGGLPPGANDWAGSSPHQAAEAPAARPARRAYLPQADRYATIDAASSATRPKGRVLLSRGTPQPPEPWRFSASGRRSCMHG
jgi:hypothetical protein